MDYGRPMKPSFIEIPNFWSWEDKFGRYILGTVYVPKGDFDFKIWGILKKRGVLLRVLVNDIWKTGFRFSLSQT